ncbi:MAG: efflux RND transporter periplasmic adaptor subunit [Chroococcidiopsidaceae cyanobacterium CP_BM_ER_R8_30]|nr:efflux RND transporter periplasmic adaptor subunit [Chroococcidiopsidaceae cyanobacterium CP_BM_ER_R8_30]
MQLTLLGKVKNPSRWFIGLVTVSVLAIGSTVFFITNRATPKSDIAELTVPVRPQNVTLRITASGTVQPVQSVNLSPKQAGILTALYVDQGDRVKQGQILARMDSSDIHAQLVQARGELEQAQAQLDLAREGNRKEDIAQARARLEQAQAQLNLARAGNRVEDIAQAQAQVEAAQAKETLTRKRVKSGLDLYQEGAVSQDKLDQVLSDEHSALAILQQSQQHFLEVQQGSRKEDVVRLTAQVAEARDALKELEAGSRPEEIAQRQAAVVTAQGKLMAAQAQLEDTIIRAPFSGTVTQKYATVGAFVTPTTSASTTASATSTSIVAVAKGLEILATVPDVDLGHIKQGQTVEIVTEAYPNQVFKGRVSLVAPEAVVKDNVTSFQVRIALITGKNKLRSGMNVDLTFLGNQIHNALVVPSVAIVTRNGQTGVLVPDAKNQATFKPVTIGPTFDSKIQILKGLDSGERVFVDLPKNQNFHDSYHF